MNRNMGKGIATAAIFIAIAACSFSPHPEVAGYLLVPSIIVGFFMWSD